MGMLDWAKNEVDIACKREAPDRKPGEWDYWCPLKVIYEGRDEQDNCENCAIAIEDRQPVIRCKDCKHRDPEDGRCDNGHDIIWNLPRPGNWFCKDGERREMNENLQKTNKTNDASSSIG